MRRKLVELEILAAVHLCAIGEWWVASAARRLGKLSGEHSSQEVLK